jgi:hypothetical protein
MQRRENYEYKIIVILILSKICVLCKKINRENVRNYRLVGGLARLMAIGTRQRSRLPLRVDRLGAMEGTEH